MIFHGSRMSNRIKVIITNQFLKEALFLIRMAWFYQNPGMAGTFHLLFQISLGLVIVGFVGHRRFLTLLVGGCLKRSFGKGREISAVVVIASEAKQSRTNFVRLKVHCVNFLITGVIVSIANNDQGNRRLLEICHVALRAPRNDKTCLEQKRIKWWVKTSRTASASPHLDVSATKLERTLNFNIALKYSLEYKADPQSVNWRYAVDRNLSSLFCLLRRLFLANPPRHDAYHHPT